MKYFFLTIFFAFCSCRQENLQDFNAVVSKDEFQTFKNKNNLNSDPEALHKFFLQKTKNSKVLKLTSNQLVKQKYTMLNNYDCSSYTDEDMINFSSQNVSVGHLDSDLGQSNVFYTTKTWTMLNGALFDVISSEKLVLVNNNNNKLIQKIDHERSYFVNKTRCPLPISWSESNHSIHPTPDNNGEINVPAAMVKVDGVLSAIGLNLSQSNYIFFNIT